MNGRAAIGALVAAVAAAGAVVPGAAGQAPPGPVPAGDPVVHLGERLDPARYGEGVVEGMEVVLERQAARGEGLTNPKARKDGQQGVWTVPSRRSSDFPHSGRHYAANKWGDTRMGIGFNAVVTVRGAFFAAQGNEGAWTTGVRAVGYRAGEVVAATDWFREIGPKPAWFAMNLAGVDRIVIEAEPVVIGAGWYGLDDLTFTLPPAAEGAEPVTRTVDFDDLGYRAMLTGSGYAGLTWEEGTGPFARVDEGVPAPIEHPDPDGDEAVTEPDAADPALAGMTVEPELLLSYTGAVRGDAGSFSYPPDTCGAAGPSHFVVTVNRIFQVYVKETGARVMNTTLGSFLPGSNGDPRVLYDQHSDRWVVIVADFNTRIYLAVSETSDPLGNWFKTSFVVSEGNDAGCWPDYPTLGVDADGIYVAAYMVGCGMSIFALEKAPLIAATPALGTITAFRGLPLEGAIQPCHTYGDSGGQLFISRNSSTALRVRQLAGDITAPTLNELGLATIPSHAFANDVPALGSTVLLDSVDRRLMNAVYRDDAIWTAHTVNVDERAAARWYQVGVPSLTLLQSGTVSDPVLHYFFPTVMVNDRGDAILGFSGSSADQYAACYFTGRGNTDPVGLMAPPQLLAAGGAAQNNIDNFGRNRWGDYSLCSLDPLDELTMWTIQEHASDLEDIWSTTIGKIEVFPAPLNNFCSASTLVGDGAHAFTNVGATTDGFPEPTTCGFAGSGDVEDDVWLRYFTSCEGDLEITLTGLDYDARLAVYDGSICPSSPDEAIACLEAPGQTSITIPITAGFKRMRLGGFDAGQGSGTLNLSCVGPCVEDCAAGGDGVVDVTDLLQVLAEWGTAPPHECDVAPSGGDGQIDVEDLLAVLAAWNPCP
ncbi:MAG: hypothetical protein ACYTG1_05980 [Planctomycetota bacterium]